MNEAFYQKPIKPELDEIKVLKRNRPRTDDDEKDFVHSVVDDLAEIEHQRRHPKKALGALAKAEHNSEARMLKSEVNRYLRNIPVTSFESPGESPVEGDERDFGSFNGGITSIRELPETPESFGEELVRIHPEMKDIYEKFEDKGPITTEEEEELLRDIGSLILVNRAMTKKEIKDFTKRAKPLPKPVPDWVEQARKNVQPPDSSER